MSKPSARQPCDPLRPWRLALGVQLTLLLSICFLLSSPLEPSKQHNSLKNDCAFANTLYKNATLLLYFCKHLNDFAPAARVCCRKFCNIFKRMIAHITGTCHLERLFFSCLCQIVLRSSSNSLWATFYLESYGEVDTKKSGLLWTRLVRFSMRI